MLAVAVGLQEQIERPLRQLGLLTTIEVRPPETGSQSAPDSSLPQPVRLDDDALRSLEALPGVQMAYPDLRLSQVRLEALSGATTCPALGVPREAVWFGTLTDAIVAGSFFSLQPESPDILITVALAQRLGFNPPQSAVGRDVRLTAEGLAPTGDQTFAMTSHSLQLRIVGVLEPPGFVGPVAGNVALLPVDLMRRLPGAVIEAGLRRIRSSRAFAVSGYSQVMVRVARLADVQPVEKAIRAMGFRTRSMFDRLQEMRTLFVAIDLILAGLGTIALVVAGLGILNTFLMAVLERYREIGIYKAMGASDADIYLLFLFEAAIIGLFGGLAGVVLSLATSWLIQLGIDIYLSERQSQVAVSLFRFPWWLPLFGLAYASFISLLGGWYPARRAARLDPIKALRHD